MASTSAKPSFEDFIQSRLFTFRVGKEGKKFVVHSGPVATISPQLNALINGGMSESQANDAKLEDIEPADFARFVEYAYRYNYTSPAWVLDKNEPETGTEKGKTIKAVPKLNPARLSLRARNAAKQVQPQQLPYIQHQGFGSLAPTPQQVTLPSRLLNRAYLSNIEANFPILKDFEYQSNTGPEQNFAPVFLAHARMYTFACERLVDPLKRLALHKMHQNLLDFTLYDRRLIDVVELARYAYDHCEDKKDDGTVDELRALVTEYIGCQISLFRRDDDFVQLLAGGGEFAVDLVRVIDGDKLV